MHSLPFRVLHFLALLNSQLISVIQIQDISNAEKKIRQKTQECKSWCQDTEKN